MQRVHSIDILRTLAIIGMICCHYVIFLYPHHSNWVYFIGNDIIGDWPAPLFVFLSGVSWQISYQQALQRDLPIFQIRNKMIRKSCLLFVLALLFQVFIFDFNEIFSWDILSTIAVSFIFLFYTRHFSAKGLLILIAVIVFIAPPLFHAFNGLNYWQEDTYLAPMRFPESLYGFLFYGYFPLIPWLSYSLLGVLLCKLLHGPSFPRYIRTIQWSSISLILLGLILAKLSIHGQEAYLLILYLAPLSEYPQASFSMLCLMFGLISLVYTLTYIYVDVMKIRLPLRLQSFTLIMSQFSLSIYVMHHIVILFISARIHNTLGLIGFTSNYAFILYGESFVYIALSYLLFQYWQTHWQAKYSLEWYLRN